MFRDTRFRVNLCQLVVYNDVSGYSVFQSALIIHPGFFQITLLTSDNYLKYILYLHNTKSNDTQRIDLVIII